MSGGEAGATIEQAADGLMVRLEREFAAPLAVVWTLLTDPEELAIWLGEAQIDPVVGGKIQYNFEQGKLIVDGVIQQLVPLETLEYTWHEGAEDASCVRFDLRPLADGTRTLLTVTHRQLAQGEGRNFAAGWQHHLELLAARLAGQAADWDWLRFEELLADYPPQE